jgi:hypothetical protein
MSDSELQSAVEESLEDNLSNGVTEYQIGNRRVRRDPQMIQAQLDALLKLRALQSPKRGMNLGRIDRPA